MKHDPETDLHLAVITNSSGTYLGYVSNSTYNEMNSSSYEGYPVRVRDAWNLLVIPQPGPGGRLQMMINIQPIHMNKGPCHRIQIKADTFYFPGDCGEDLKKTYEDLMNQVNEQYKTAKLREETGLIAGASPAELQRLAKGNGFKQ